MATGSAPGELELVRAFVNTLEVDDGRDELSSPAALAAWLRDHALAHGGGASRADLEAARRLREGLRALMLANNGVSVRKEASATLDRVARSSGLAVRFRSGRPSLEPAGSGVEAALGRLLGVVGVAMLDGTWSRLKACRAPDCRWAFYDRARNRSRTWCSMAVCGNRAKARAYRSRNAASLLLERHRVTLGDP